MAYKITAEIRKNQQAAVNWIFMSKSRLTEKQAEKLFIKSKQDKYGLLFKNDIVINNFKCEEI